MLSARLPHRLRSRLVELLPTQTACTPLTHRAECMSAGRPPRLQVRGCVWADRSQSPVLRASVFSDRQATRKMRSVSLVGGGDAAGENPDPRRGDGRDGGRDGAREPVGGVWKLREGEEGSRWGQGPPVSGGGHEGGAECRWRWGGPQGALGFCGGRGRWGPPDLDLQIQRDAVWRRACPEVGGCRPSPSPGPTEARPQGGSVVTRGNSRGFCPE